MTVSKKHKFKLLRGRHIDEDGKLYHARDNEKNVIYTDIDLHKHFNDVKFEKFQRMDYSPAPLSREEAPAPSAVAVVEAPEDGLGEKSIPELWEYAAQEEIELGDASTKDQILEIIRTASDGGA